MLYAFPFYVLKAVRRQSDFSPSPPPPTPLLPPPPRPPAPHGPLLSSPGSSSGDTEPFVTFPFLSEDAVLAEGMKRVLQQSGVARNDHDSHKTLDVCRKQP